MEGRGQSEVTAVERPWVEPLCAVLMAVSSLATAWCSYQNSRWSGQTSDLEAREDVFQRQALELTLESRQIQSAHLQLVMKAIDAKIAGDEKISRFYIDRFPPELKAAWEKWISLDPFNSPSAPPHPFAVGQYTQHYAPEIRAAQAAAADAGTRANATGNTAGGYLGNTVLLASVLFFAGTAGKFKQRHVQQSSLAFALALFLYAIARTLMLPVG